MIRSQSDHRLLPSLATSPNRRRIEYSSEQRQPISQDILSDSGHRLASALGFAPESVLNYGAPSAHDRTLQNVDDFLTAGLNSLFISGPMAVANQRPATAPLPHELSDSIPTAAPDSNFSGLRVRATQSTSSSMMASHSGPARARARGAAPATGTVGAASGPSISATSPTSPTIRQRNTRNRNTQRFRNQLRELIEHLNSENPLRRPVSQGFSPTDSRAGSTDSSPLAGPSRETAVITMSDLHYLQTYDMRNNFYLNLVTWSRPHNKIAVAVKDKAYWWDGLRYVAQINLQGNQKPISVISCGPTGVLAVGLQDGLQGCLSLFLNARRRLTISHDCSFQCIAWFSTGPFLAVGDMLGRIYIMEYDYDSVVVKAEWRGFDQQVCGMYWNTNRAQIIPAWLSNCCFSSLLFICNLFLAH
ncbi:hypothetical protein PUMCH_004820 [Australozyma saopauloensis]|uniref:Uncharacterized protein n=1 Tax=Australozyma saopauloensis TaxID=291208 RepID=A0AAX4HGB3_9ASCO|nr:hypothetical protein PUMCH_004820 [[Candida] saopauloensis]